MHGKRKIAWPAGLAVSLRGGAEADARGPWRERSGTGAQFGAAVVSRRDRWDDAADPGLGQEPWHGLLSCPRLLIVSGSSSWRLLRQPARQARTQTFAWQRTSQKQVDAMKAIRALLVSGWR